MSKIYKICICILSLISLWILLGMTNSFSTNKDESLLISIVNEATTKVVNDEEVKQSMMLVDVPLLLQKPELMRGCEVTSLAMVLNYYDIKVDKMDLAKNITHVPFKTKGIMGNMNKGFVGDMKTYNNPGLGVYVDPIIELTKRYVSEDRIINLSNKDPEELYRMVAKGYPVWVLTNAEYKKLPDNEFESWNTDIGEMRVTFRQHSVVMTGYDQNYIYINDPLKSESNLAVDRKDFEKAWVQMGSQAMTISN